MDTAVVASIRVPLVTEVRVSLVAFVNAAAAVGLVVLGAAADGAVDVQDVPTGTVQALSVPNICSCT
jgi:hypothetical protein